MIKWSYFSANVVRWRWTWGTSERVRHPDGGKSKTKATNSEGIMLISVGTVFFSFKHQMEFCFEFIHFECSNVSSNNSSRVAIWHLWSLFHNRSEKSQWWCKIAKWCKISCIIIMFLFVCYLSSNLFKYLNLLYSLIFPDS